MKYHTQSKEAKNTGTNATETRDDNGLPTCSLMGSDTKGELWRQAAAEVGWKSPPGLDLDTSSTLGLLDGLRQEALLRMDQAKAGQRTLRLRSGKEVTFRDMWGKVLVWVKRFQMIGDIAIQADAGYASLPWV